MRSLSRLKMHYTAGYSMTDDSKQQAYFEKDQGFRAYNHPVVRFFARQRVEYLRTLLNLEAVGNALDVGCGSGFSTYYMKQHIEDIWAVDRSPAMLRQHPLQGSARLFEGDALRLPFADNSFDLVYAWEVLHHIPRPELAVAEMARVSRRYVLVAEPNPLNLAQFLFALVDAEHRWVLRYRLPFMRKLFRTGGLKIKFSGSGGWIFPNKTPLVLLPFLSRLPYRSPWGISNWVLGCKKSENRS